VLKFVIMRPIPPSFGRRSLGDEDSVEPEGRKRAAVHIVEPASAAPGDTMAVMLERANAEIARLRQQVAAYQREPQRASNDFVPLKRAVPPDVSAETIRQWAQQKLILAFQDGSRWFVSQASLDAKLARWRAGRS
jgi:hypothetical protein